MHEDKDEQQRKEEDAILMNHCKRCYLATKLGYDTAVNLVVDTLIEYCFQVNCMLVEKHVNWTIETLSNKSGL